MLKLDNINGGIGKLDFFDNIQFVGMFEHDNIAEGIGECDLIDNIEIVFELERDNTIGEIGEHGFFDNIDFVKLLELDNITEGIGELDHFDNIEIVWLFEHDNIINTRFRKEWANVYRDEFHISLNFQKTIYGVLLLQSFFNHVKVIILWSFCAFFIVCVSVLYVNYFHSNVMLYFNGEAQ